MKKPLFLVTYVGGSPYYDHNGEYDNGESIEGKTTNPERWVKRHNADRGWVEYDKWSKKKLVEFLMTKGYFDAEEDAKKEDRETLIDICNDNYQENIYEYIDEFEFTEI